LNHYTDTQTQKRHTPTPPTPTATPTSAQFQSDGLHFLHPHPATLAHIPSQPHAHTTAKNLPEFRVWSSFPSIQHRLLAARASTTRAQYSVILSLKTSTQPEISHCNTLHQSVTICNTDSCPRLNDESTVFDGSFSPNLNSLPNSTLQHTATHCNLLQHTATLLALPAHGRRERNILIIIVAKRQLNPKYHTATHCNTLQHTATHCTTLQHTATPLDTRTSTTRAQCSDNHVLKTWSQPQVSHCNTLQHSATLCNNLQHRQQPAHRRQKHNTLFIILSHRQLTLK